jgi:hypothetical protein
MIHFPSPIPPHEPEPLPLRWVVILLAAAFVAATFGILTGLSTGWPAGVLAALSAAGATVSALHRMLGR